MLTKENIEAAALDHEEDLSINEDGDEEDGIDLEPSEDSVKAGSSNNEDNKVIAQEETKAVGRLKLAVFFVLVASAVAVACTVSKLIRHNEYKRFKNEFEDDGGKVLQAVGITFDKTLRSFDSVATTFTTIAEVTNQTWPFVTIPMVAVLDISNAIHIDFIPVVAPQLREQWEDYSSMHDGWINEALAIQERYTAEYSGPIIYNAAYEKRIHDDDGKILEQLK